MQEYRTEKSGAGLVVLCLVVIAGLVACSMPEAAVHAKKGGEGEDPEILAVVGSDPITAAEVEARVAAQLMKLDQERFQALRDGLDQVVAERLLALEAGKRGITVPELLAQEVEAKVVEPTAAEIDAFYEERQAQIRQPKAEVEDRIREFLKRNEEAELNRELIAGLKEKYGYQMLLEPVRAAVVADGFPAKGPAEAPVTIVEFSDFECPYCARVNPTLDQILESYGEKVRLVFRQFPLNNIHPNAQKAAEAALCADEQGRFWQMHDLMFTEQRSLGVEQLKEKASRLQLDVTAFNECLDSSRHADSVVADLKAGSDLGVTGTPALFINGRFLSGAQPFEEFARVIEEELALQKADS